MEKFPQIWVVIVVDKLQNIESICFWKILVGKKLNILLQ